MAVESEEDDGAWLFDVVHALGAAYGWDKKTVLDQIFPDEIEPYLKRIRRDETNRNLTQLALIHNPHVKEPNKLIQQLEKQLRGIDGAYWASEVMDEENQNKLLEIRKRMQANARNRHGRKEG